MLTKTTDKTSSAVRALKRETAKLVTDLQGTVAVFTGSQVAQAAYS